MPELKISKKQGEEILYYYVECGLGQKETAKRVFGTQNAAPIKRFLQENNIPIKHRGQVVGKCPAVEKIEALGLVPKILEAYKTKGLKAIAEEFGYDYTAIQKILEKNNVIIREPGGIRRFDINDYFFLSQSQNLAYIIGMLGSDGCVASNTNQIYIELQRRDKEILERINKVIGNTRPVKDYETGRGYENSKLWFISREIKNELAKYKIIPNKTYDPNYGFPDILLREFYIDYIRGLFDGDGSIKKHGNDVAWQIDSSSEEICVKIKEFLKEFGISAYITKQHKVNIDLFRVAVYKKEDLKTLFNLLYYPNVELFMQRKYLKFKESI